MTLCLIILLVLMLWRISFAGKGYFDDYLGREQSQSIKGIFVVLVFLRHFKQYIRFRRRRRRLEKPFLLFNYYSGQLIVAMFLFYSGYGILSSIMKKGPSYVQGMPKKKFLRLFIRFDIVVLCYLILQWLIGVRFTFPQALGALLGWDSLGNSSWYIFTILFCYAATWLAFRISGRRFNVSAAKADSPAAHLPENNSSAAHLPENNSPAAHLPENNSSAAHSQDNCSPAGYYTTGIVLTAVILGLYCLVMSVLKADAPRYYNTVFCYAAGMCYAYFKENAEAFLCKGNLRYMMTVLSETALFAVLCYLFLKTGNMALYLALSAVFSVLVVHLTMKFRICNPVLMVFGSYVFEVYMLQRLPMIALKQVQALHGHPYPYLVLCMLITAALSYGYRHIEDKWL